MWIFPLVGYVGVLVGFAFLTLAVASGLYYLSELVEEHTVPARRLLVRAVHAVIAVLVALYLVDGLPLGPVVLAVAAHLVYLAAMRRFPFVQLTDPLFLLSCVAVLVNHYVWFRHFSDAQAAVADAWRRASYLDAPDVGVAVPSFTMIAAFFGLCVWLVPFALFVSLSAGDNVLPTVSGAATSSSGGVAMDGDDTRGISLARRRNGNRPQAMIKAVVDWARGTIGELVGGARRDSRF